MARFFVFSPTVLTLALQQAFLLPATKYRPTLLNGDMLLEVSACVKSALFWLHVLTRFSKRKRTWWKRWPSSLLDVH